MRQATKVTQLPLKHVLQKLSSIKGILPGESLLHIRYIKQNRVESSVCVSYPSNMTYNAHGTATLMNSYVILKTRQAQEAVTGHAGTAGTP